MGPTPIVLTGRPPRPNEIRRPPAFGLADGGDRRLTPGGGLHDYSEVDWLQPPDKEAAFVDAARIYEVLDGLPEAQAARKWEGRAAFAEAMTAYREGRFEVAKRGFERVLGDVPEDGPARLYVERCRAMAAAPPPDWDGVTVLTEK